MKSLLLTLLSFVVLRTSSAADQRPNIIFIFADDFGWADLGCYGHPYARTPNIDKLSTEGTKFMQFYATGVTCCPSRTGFMTSWLPARYATYPANGGFGDRVTLTELLHNNGYHTGHFGKWHIGPDEKAGTYGIDETPGTRAEGKKKDERGRDAMIYDAAIQFIEKNKAGPFYLNVWGHISHHPIDPPQSYVDRFKDLTVDESKFEPGMQEKFETCRKLGGDVNEHMRAYLADVNSMDDGVGRLLKKVDELGLRENTIVVFSSDQGPAPMRGVEDLSAKKQKRDRLGSDLRLNAMGNTGILRGGSTACMKAECASLSSSAGPAMCPWAAWTRSPSAAAPTGCPPSASLPVRLCQRSNSTARTSPPPGWARRHTRARSHCYGRPARPGVNPAFVKPSGNSFIPRGRMAETLSSTTSWPIQRNPKTWRPSTRTS
jgi:hypothetical protein